MSGISSGRSLALALGVVCAALGGSMQSAIASPVTTNVWYLFSFGDFPPGPLGPTGRFTIPPDAEFRPRDGHPVVPASLLPWTISLSGPARLTVVDLFLSIDQFEMFDDGKGIGLTSVPVPGSSCDEDITCALANPAFSRRVYDLAAGNHSLSGLHTRGAEGVAVFEITAVEPVPEPASLGLLAAALAGFGLFRRRKQRA